MMPLLQAVDEGFKVGMHQHYDEILPFSRWLLQRYVRPLGNVLEIGTLHGGTATLWHSISTGTVISVDLPNGTFGGLHHNLNQRACEERNSALNRKLPRFCGVLGDSHSPEIVDTVQRLLDGETVDLLFIDGDHTAGGVIQDFLFYKQFVTPYGVVAFHDILDTPLHRAANCCVSDFWEPLVGEKHVFSVNSTWGGIGALVV